MISYVKEPPILLTSDKIHALSMEGVELSSGEATGNASKLNGVKENEQEARMHLSIEPPT
jgi:hypothetical protein